MRKAEAAEQSYDDMYLTDDRTYERPRSSPYYPLYRRVLGLLTRGRVRSVLEVGCGSGVLAQMLIDAGICYTGFDLSEVAVQKAKALNPTGKFFVASATDPAAYAEAYEAILCCEVLEHIDSDLEAIRLWPKRALCVGSLPNFDYATHVRFFRTEQEVTRRYGELIAIQQVSRLAKSARANLSWAEYFRRLRWARNQPTHMLGILGVNAFSWYGGWFVFVGRRR